MPAISLLAAMCCLSQEPEVVLPGTGLLITRVLALEGNDQISMRRIARLAKRRSIPIDWVYVRLPRSVVPAYGFTALLARPKGWLPLAYDILGDPDLDSNSLGLDLMTMVDRFFSLPVRSVVGPVSALPGLVGQLDPRSGRQCRSLLQGPLYRGLVAKLGTPKRGAAVVREVPGEKAPALDTFFQFSDQYGWRHTRRLQVIGKAVIDAGVIKEWPLDSAVVPRNQHGNRAPN